MLNAPESGEMRAMAKSTEAQEEQKQHEGLTDAKPSSPLQGSPEQPSPANVPWQLAAGDEEVKNASTRIPDSGISK